MALDGTTTTISLQDIGDGGLAVVDLQGPTEYDQAAGGEDPIAQGNKLGMRVGSRFDSILGSAEDPADGYAKWNPTTGMLQLFTLLNVEQADDFDASSFIYRLTVQGR